MMRPALALICLMWMSPTGAEEVPFARVVGENPSVYRRPLIDDRHLIGQARSDEEYPLLRELDTGLPRPFFQILYHARPGWIYGNSVVVTTRDLPVGQLTGIVEARRSAEEAVGSELRELLRLYNRHRERLAGTYGLDDLPGLELAAGQALEIDYRENCLSIRLEVEGGERRLRLPRSDRFLFQTIVALALQRLEPLEACRLVLRFAAGGPEAVITISRTRWENADDLSLETFWNLVEVEHVENLWQAP